MAPSGALAMAEEPIDDRLWKRALTILVVKVMTNKHIYRLWNHSNGVLFASKFCIKVEPSGRLAEAHTMRFVAKHTSIPVPMVYCAFIHRGTSYIVMEKIEGDFAGRGWMKRPEESKRKILKQLGRFIQQLRAVDPPDGVAVANVLGGSIYDPRLPVPSLRGPFGKFDDFHSSLLNGFDFKDDAILPEDLRELVEFYKTAPTKPVLTHGDLSSLNFLVRGDEVVAIIDWETAGWFPSYWEYSRAWNVSPRIGYWQQEVDKFLTPLPHELRMESIRLKYFGDF